MYKLFNKIHDRKRKVLYFFGHSFNFCSHFLSLCKWLPNIWGVKNANVNLKTVNKIKLKYYWSKRIECAAVFSICIKHHKKVRE